ncbi:MAG: hypothetical protein KAU01_00310 [Candidatus Cloacimonetes bacterium]|nr:hypothetical protein [Candidatus Cloacimonadota bacterium]
MKQAVFTFCLIFIFCSLSAHELMQKTLLNGMEIIVKENNLNESIGFYCFVKTGEVSTSQYFEVKPLLVPSEPDLSGF